MLINLKINILAKIKNLILRINRKHHHSFFIRQYMNFYNYYFMKLNNLKFYEHENPDKIYQYPNEMQKFRESKKYANAILDMWLYILNKLINIFKKEYNCKDYNFVDVGCGSGIATIFAKKKFDFQSVSGFDIFEKCIERSKDNIARAGLKDINVFVADAKNFKLENKKYFFYMFNPFEAEILNKFMENNIDRLIKTSSVIAYVNQIGDELKIIEKFKYKKIVKDNYYRSSVIFY
tara:strand:+ start:684 stop:1388 length:705 start_codon:yes stop_codon:yes gene_type:complete